MKVLKWFRYGFLSLGFVLLILSHFLPAKFSSEFIFTSLISFIFYNIVRIVEICKGEKESKPMILYNFGLIMGFMVLCDIIPNYAPIYHLLNIILRGEITSPAAEILVSVYFVLMTLFLLFSVFWNFINECKGFHSNDERINSLSKNFWSFGTSFIFLGVLWRLFNSLVYIHNSHIFTIAISLVSILFFYVSFPLFITGIILKIIHIININKKGRVINEEQ